MANTNDNLLLICGSSAGGKSASLRNIQNPEGVMYLNCESNKKLPFSPVKFKQYTILDPLQINEAFVYSETKPEIHTIVIDTLTFLMDMYESKYVIGSTDTMRGWSNYAQYYKKIMQEYVAGSSKNVIFLAHVQEVLNESEMVMQKKVPVKGALSKNGIEAFFSTIISARTIAIEKLEKYENDLLTFTPEEELLGYKYVYQTQLTKETVNERIRSPMGMWSIKETFIDNDAQLVLNRLKEYYS